MTRKNYADLVKLRVGFTSVDNRWDDRIVWQIGDRVRGKLIYIYQKNSQSKGEFVKEMYFDVQTDSITQRKYIETSGQVLNMPDNSGVVSLSLTKGDYSPFTITNVGQIGIYNNLEASDIGITTWQQGSRWLFNNLGYEVKKVMVIGIPSIASLDDNENIPIPYGTEDDFVEQTAQRIINPVPQDRTDDTRETVE